MILRILIKRKDNSRYLNGGSDLDKFEETDPPDTFFEEWLKKKTIYHNLQMIKKS